MNIPESNHIVADLGIPTWTQNQRPSDNNRQERLSIQIVQGENFGLELLWVLESTLAMEPELEKALDKVVTGPCFTAAELPTPKPEERKAPGSSISPAGALLELIGVQEDGDCLDNDDDED